MLSIAVGIVLVLSYVKITTAQETQQYETPLSQKQAVFSLDNPPSDSLIGNIATMSGIIDWQSRAATEPAKLHTPVQIEQGELLQTEDTGAATVQFTNCCSLIVSPDTQVNFVQTLPANVVIGQPSGTVEYSVTNSIPLAVRSLDLLININTGNVIFSVSKTQPFISVYVKKGSMQASFNDLNYNSTVIPVTAGETFYFNDTTREENIE